MKLIFLLLSTSLVLFFPVKNALSSPNPIKPLLTQDPFEDIPHLTDTALGGWLDMGTPQAEVLEKLGQPDHKGEEIFWHATGLYGQQWDYPGIQLQMESVQPGEPKTVGAIIITAPCEFKTERGIGIGSTNEEVMAAYPEYKDSTYQGQDYFYAGHPFRGGILFEFEDGKVYKIVLSPGPE